MREPLGVDPKVWSQRNEIQRKTYGKHKSWQRGLEAGEKGESATANPYTLSEEIQKLLRQRAYWELGRQEGAFTPSRHQLKKEKKARKEEARRMKRRKEKKHKEHHHGHKGHSSRH
jgi:uncharacterized protein involved in exopolysaccharide biosynthesis